jgi:hypothetical protein
MGTAMTNREEWQPCPFCGTELTGPNEAGYYVHSPKDCFLGEYEIEPSAMGEWNRRAALSRSQDVARVAEPSVFEWLETEVTAIDCWYRGDPSYEHDAHWMKDKVLKLIGEAREAFIDPQPAQAGASDEFVSVPPGLTREEKRQFVLDHAAPAAPAVAPMAATVERAWHAGRNAWMAATRHSTQEASDSAAIAAMRAVLDAARAQADPIAWVRFCSDGTIEGPIMDAYMEDVRKSSGAWTPLVARSEVRAPAQAEQHRALSEEQIDAVMEQAQVFASAWSLVGGVFDHGDALETAEQEKANLRALLATIYGVPNE